MVMRKNIESDEESLPTEEESARRTALNRLEASGVRNSVPHERAAPLHQANRGSLQFSQPPPPSAKKQSTFSLFKVVFNFILNGCILFAKSWIPYNNKILCTCTVPLYYNFCRMKITR
jgi:hypothetical protein